MPFIFISYSHKDSEYANRLADSLEAKGLDVWIDERIDYKGDEVVPLDEAAVEAAVRSLVEAGVKAIAIAFLWSFKNPDHELRALEIVRRVAPDVYVSCSHKVAPRMGEYERTVATVINSYVAPASAAYFRRAADKLNEAGLRHPLLIMQISGGVLPADFLRNVGLEVETKYGTA